MLVLPKEGELMRKIAWLGFLSTDNLTTAGDPSEGPWQGWKKKEKK
jgi:hypothetical protein